MRFVKGKPKLPKLREIPGEMEAWSRGEEQIVLILLFSMQKNLLQRSSTVVHGKPRQGCLKCDIHLISSRKGKKKKIKGAVVAEVSAAAKDFPHLSSVTSLLL